MAQCVHDWQASYMLGWLAGRRGGTFGSPPLPSLVQVSLPASPLAYWMRPLVPARPLAGRSLPSTEVARPLCTCQAGTLPQTWIVCWWRHSQRALAAPGRSSGRRIQWHSILFRRHSLRSACQLERPTSSPAPGSARALVRVEDIHVWRITARSYVYGGATSFSAVASD